MMLLASIVLAFGLGILLYVKYSEYMHGLYVSNPNFLESEKRRRENNFNADGRYVSRGPTIDGNRYEEKDGKIIVTAERRSSILMYKI